VVVQRTSVGLDVHARSVVASALDGVSGELLERRLTPAHAEVAAWIEGLAGPVKVTYEAGPTGFGLARFLRARGVDVEVAAPSKLLRPSGDRVKTDVRDARHLARLLHAGQIVAVAVPDEATEAARDLVRAREDARGDLMSARHRVAKLLLRQGIVWSGGKAWTGVHDRWLRTQRFESVPLQLTYDTAYETMLAALARRDRLDEAIAALAADSAFTPVVHRLGCLRGVSTLTAFGLAVEIGDWHRFTGRSIGAYLGLVPSESSPVPPAARAGSPRPATATPAGCWSRPPGTTGPPTAPRARTCVDAGSRPVPPPATGAGAPTTGCTPGGRTSTPAASAP
jgi:transposase